MKQHVVQSSGAVWKSLMVLMVSVDVKQHWTEQNVGSKCSYEDIVASTENMPASDSVKYNSYRHMYARYLLFNLIYYAPFFPPLFFFFFLVKK